MRKLGVQQKEFMRLMLDLSVLDGRDVVTGSDICVHMDVPPFRAHQLARSLERYQMIRINANITPNVPESFLQVGVELNDLGLEYAYTLPARIVEMPEK